MLQDGGVTSRQLRVSPSKASWSTLLKWSTQQLPFGRREPDLDTQPDQVPMHPSLTFLVLGTQQGVNRQHLECKRH